MSQYSSLNDPSELHDERGFIKSSVVCKFCSLGFVTSEKWFPGYIVIYDGVLKLYDNEETIKYNAQNTVLEIPLNHLRRPSVGNAKHTSRMAVFQLISIVSILWSSMNGWAE